MLSDLKLWVDVFQSVFLVGIALATWIGARTRANKEAIVELQNQNRSQNQRLTKLETRQESAVDHDDIGAIHKRMDGLSRQISRIEGEMKQLNQSVAVVTEHLIGQNR